MSKQSIAYVDLTRSEITYEAIGDEMRKNFIGGGGINTKILYDSDAMYHDALSEENVLIFGAGCLVDTGVLAGNRMVVSAKSPVTDMFGDSNVGGPFPVRMRNVGIDHLVVRGKADNPVYLLLKADGTIEIRSAEGVWGKYTDETTDILTERHGSKCEVACIGTAGETLVLFSSVIMSRHHAAGRVGMGCVMGSKRLKAVVIEYQKTKLLPERPEEFKRIRTTWLRYCRKSVPFAVARVYGTMFLIEANMRRGQLPVKNSMQGHAEDKINILPDMFKVKHQEKALSCYGCPVGCSKSYRVKEGRFKGEKGEGMEFGAAVIGPNLGIYDWDKIIHLKLLCDHMGVDTMEASTTLGLILEGCERGLIDEALVGRKVTFGNVDDAEYLMHKMNRREGIGDHIANGAYRAGQSLGCEDYAFCINKSSTGLCSNKRLVRSLGYITSTRGGDHLKSFAFTMQNSGFYIAKHLFNIKKASKQLASTDKKGRVLWWHENYKNVDDAIGVCLFALHGLPGQGHALYDDFASILGAYFGLEFTELDVLKASERIYQLQNSFNVNCGLRLEDYQWPVRKVEEGVDEKYLENTVIDCRDEDGMLPEYFAYRGLKDGIPSVEKFTELDMRQYLDRAHCIPCETAKSFEDILKEVKIVLHFTWLDRIKVAIQSNLVRLVINKKSESTQKKLRKRIGQ